MRADLNRQEAHPRFRMPCWLHSATPCSLTRHTAELNWREAQLLQLELSMPI